MSLSSTVFIREKLHGEYITKARLLYLVKVVEFYSGDRFITAIRVTKDSDWDQLVRKVRERK